MPTRLPSYPPYPLPTLPPIPFPSIICTYLPTRDHPPRHHRVPPVPVLLYHRTYRIPLMILTLPTRNQTGSFPHSGLTHPPRAAFDSYERLLSEGFGVISGALAEIDQIFVDTKFEFGYVLQALPLSS